MEAGGEPLKAATAAATAEDSGSAAVAAATAVAATARAAAASPVLWPLLKLDGGTTTCSIARVKIPVGTRLRHETKGVCTLTEVAANGSWVVQFDASGNTRTYKPNSQHNLKVEGGQVSRRPPPPPPPPPQPPQLPPLLPPLLPSCHHTHCALDHHQAKPADVVVAVEEGYHAGDRVVHSKHGLGVVMHRLPDGRAALPKCPYGSAPAWLLHLLRARLSALGSSALLERGQEEEAGQLGA